MGTYIQEYNSKLISAERAAKLVNSNDIIDYGMFATKPVDFDAALARRVDDDTLQNVSIRGTGTILPIPEVIKNDTQQKTFQYFSWYFTLIDRKASDLGLACHNPFNYHEATGMASNPEYAPYWPKVWCAQVSPMDDKGCFNFGLGNSHNRAMALSSEIAIVEVNANMPRCPGGNDEYLHISEIDYIIEGSNSPIFVVPTTTEPTPEEKKIAGLIVEDIPSGACIQLGIGSLPNLIGKLIADSDLHDLGVQSEMFCDAYLDMYEKGKITNSKKAYDVNKSAYSFCLGSQETYDFLHENPRCASYTVDYTNNPFYVARHDNMISINNILEVDLLSQVCSESYGLRQISGTGGQLDFVVGAFHSKGGKSFLAFSSTFLGKDGKMHSRIKPLLTPGAAVTVPRTQVQYLVTEYGKFNFKGRSIWGRAEALVNIAHPNFRDELIKAAQEMKIWSRTNRIPF